MFNRDVINKICNNENSIIISFYDCNYNCNIMSHFGSKMRWDGNTIGRHPTVPGRAHPPLNVERVDVQIEARGWHPAQQCSSVGHRQYSWCSGWIRVPRRGAPGLECAVMWARYQQREIIRCCKSEKIKNKLSKTHIQINTQHKMQINSQEKIRIGISTSLPVDNVHVTQESPTERLS